VKRPRPIKLLRRCCFGCFAWVLFIVVLGGWWVGTQLRPVGGPRRVERVTVPRGAQVSSVAATLAEKDLIRSRLVFTGLALARRASSNLRAGTYRITTDMSTPQILDAMRRGDTVPDDVAVTIPEGFTIRQIAERMKTKRIVSEAKRMENLATGSTDPFQAAYPLPRKNLEGYLFPETYRFLPNSSPEKVIQAMLDTFDKQFYSRHQEEIRRTGHTLHELVTIASLIEREAQAPEDRAKIAGVIENRLRRKMRLEIDATVIYAKGRHVTRVYYKDLAIDSPYNTYRNRGLPPGPIASPGLASLEAALHPDAHEFLFYVALPGGAHSFAKTKAEHDRNVARRRSLMGL
jgi:UPF0755 protein